MLNLQLNPKSLSTQIPLKELNYILFYKVMLGFLSKKTCPSDKLLGLESNNLRKKRQRVGIVQAKILKWVLKILMLLLIQKNKQLGQKKKILEEAKRIAYRLCNLNQSLETQ